MVELLTRLMLVLRVRFKSRTLECAACTPPRMNLAVTNQMARRFVLRKGFDHLPDDRLGRWIAIYGNPDQPSPSMAAEYAM